MGGKSPPPFDNPFIECVRVKPPHSRVAVAKMIPNSEIESNYRALRAVEQRGCWNWLSHRRTTLDFKGNSFGRDSEFLGEEIPSEARLRAELQGALKLRKETVLMAR
jgi:hypothetical protein